MSAQVAASVPGRAAVDTPGDWFEALYRASAGDVYAYAASLLRDRAAAEDVTALAFERAFRRRRLFSPRRGSARMWVFAIARNAALDELRKRKRTAELTREPAGEILELFDEQDRSAQRAVVRAAIESLDPRERELVLLKFYAQLSNRELARVVGVSESNVGTRLHRAIEKLREACDASA
jgi:RNA polymerase sigma-70 factor, ECF subfamily